MASVGAMIRRPVPAGTAVASGLIGLMAGVVLAAALTAGMVSGPTTLHPHAAGVAAISSELISHDRSEQDLGLTSVGGQQVAHNRSEEGLSGQ